MTSKIGELDEIGFIWFSFPLLSFVLISCFVQHLLLFLLHSDHLCGLVVGVLGYRSRGLGFDSQHYQIFREVMGLERGPLSLVSTIEELLGRKSSGSDLEIQEYHSRERPLSAKVGINFADKRQFLYFAYRQRPCSLFCLFVLHIVFFCLLKW
jgi:hypothetical protein